MKRPAWTLCVAVLAFALQACGGGGSYDDEPVTVGPPDCRAHPEQCK